MAYSGDPSSSALDAVRFWAQDTSASPLLSDAEIDYLIEFAHVDPEQNPIDAAALVADRIAAKYVGDVNISADGVNYSGDQLQSRYSLLAKELRREAGRTGGRGAVPYIGGLQDGRQFGVRMHDNPQAGSQRYYGEEWPVDPDLDAGRVGR